MIIYTYIPAYFWLDASNILGKVCLLRLSGQNTTSYLPYGSSCSTPRFYCQGSHSIFMTQYHMSYIVVLTAWSYSVNSIGKMTQNDTEMCVCVIEYA